MLGWILGLFDEECDCGRVKSSATSYKSRCNDIKYQKRQKNNHLEGLCLINYQRFLEDYHKINRYAKSFGYSGVVDFFHYLTEYHDVRFLHLENFLYKVRYIRHDIVFKANFKCDIDQKFLSKLEACVEVCRAYDNLPEGRTLSLD